MARKYRMSYYQFARKLSSEGIVDLQTTKEPKEAASFRWATVEDIGRPVSYEDVLVSRGHGWVAITRKTLRKRFGIGG